MLSVFSLSKTYALTGARIGYLVLPAEIDGTFRAVHESTTSCANGPAQRAALAAMQGDQAFVRSSAEHYRRNTEAAD
ncbi:aminotransferase class I/II-fold pyridoxal phosphate-dependent enzyme [Arthrobacter sp. ISL-72]|uniref:aminotransferase class I/II-fold pyridoxal phosphate-dependent enzyme n=1 Tax=Arthrobacter sp. ISL-72 TaxID=2819114 RepID=UPI001BE67ECC|nr:aminotransferase class I/II-fold pyridoxal phosphate-dependent enzyme [Arthrobacter sp. ISL-72]